MSNHYKYPTHAKHNFIKSIQKTLINAGIYTEAYDTLLRGIKTKNLASLNKSLKYLFGNNCLTDTNFKKLFSLAENNDFSTPFQLKALRALNNSNLLNQDNLDNVFYTPATLYGRTWARVINQLFNEDLMTQDNLNKILFHQDAANVINAIDFFYLAGGRQYHIFNQDLIDKITSQNDLARFNYLIDYIPDSIWQGAEPIAPVIDKLFDCNKKLGGHNIIKENREKLDYTSLDQAHFHRILDKCVSAPTSQAAADIFNHEEPIPLSYNELDADRENKAKPHVEREGNTPLRRGGQHLLSQALRQASPFFARGALAFAAYDVVNKMQQVAQSGDLASDFLLTFTNATSMR